MDNYSSPIFLLGSHKSGSSLLRSLLDNHDALTVLPSEAHFFQYSGFWVDYALRKSDYIDLDLKARLQKLHRFIAEENHCDDPFGASVMKERYNPDLFREVINSFSGDSLKEAIDCYFNAIYYSWQRKNIDKNTRIVEKSVENAEYASVYKGIYPDAKFVHIVRNPYATLVAIRKSRPSPGYPPLKSIIEALYNSYYFLYKNEMTIGDYLVIRFEDLVSDTSATMKIISDFLSIEFNDKLLMPTINGELWQGNSTGNEKFNGISTAPLERWKNNISDFEIISINKKLRHIITKYQYGLLEPRHHKLRQIYEPFKNEKLQIYVRNRLNYLLN